MSCWYITIGAPCFKNVSQENYWLYTLENFICHQKLIKPKHNRNYQIINVTFRYHLDFNYFVFLIFNKLGNKLDAHAWMQRVIPGCNFVVEMWFSNFGGRHDKWYTYLKYCLMAFGFNIFNYMYTTRIYPYYVRPSNIPN